MAYFPVLTKLTQSPWFLNFSGMVKEFQPPCLHSSLLVGGPTPWASSNAPMSQAGPWGRMTPLWSVVTGVPVYVRAGIRGAHGDGVHGLAGGQQRNGLGRPAVGFQAAGIEPGGSACLDHQSE